MNNRSQLYGSFAAALLLPAVALLVTRKMELFVACLSLGMAALALLGWSQARASVRASFEKPLPVHWLAAPPIPTEKIPRGFHEELLGLNYHPLGWLGCEMRGSATAVYAHAELPIYVLLTLRFQADAVEVETLQFESFFAQSVRLITTTDRDFAYAAAGVRNPGVRLFQLREHGTPTALDGQHVGTVRAWMVGKRVPLPAERERLLTYLEADQSALREQLRANGWVSLPGYLLGLFGRRRGILRF